MRVSSNSIPIPVAWHRLFRRVDANDSGSMSFFDFKKIIRKHLKMPPSTLTDGLMNATWVALDCDDQGGVSVHHQCRLCSFHEIGRVRI